MASIDYDSVALLNGVDLQNDEVYAKELGSVETIVNNAGAPCDFWKAATEDALARQTSTSEYVSLMEEKIVTFMESSHVTDRDLATERLKRYATRKDVHILLGGKSTGKTKVLQSFCEKHSSDDDDLGAMLVYVNGRAETLKQGLIKALEKIKDDGFWKDFDSLAFLSGLGICTSLAIEGVDLATGGIGATAKTAGEVIGVSGLAGQTLKKVIDTLFAETEDPTEGLIKLLLEIAEEKKKTPCLIIDEANLVIKGKDEDTEKLIGSILHATKEKKKLSCILCSSQHSYPYKLKEGGLQLDLADILFLPELAPQLMWHFLTSEKYPTSDDFVVGMGPQLAKRLISVSGGRIAFAARIVTDLQFHGPEFSIDDRLDTVEGATEIGEMLKPGEQSKYSEHLDENGRENLAKLLVQMCKYGYCKIAPNLHCKAKLTSILIDNGVAGVVRRSHYLHRDWRTVFGPRDHSEILVPSSATLRLVIATQMKILDVQVPDSPCK